MKRKNAVNTAHIRAAALLLAALAAAGFAVRFALQPRLERQKAQQQQSELLESIRQGDGVLAMDNAQWTIDNVDYYDSPAGGEEQEYDVFFPIPVDTRMPPADGDASSKSDHSQLSTVNSQLITGIGILSIDSIGLELPVGKGVSNLQLKVSPGHVPQTAAIGDTGNAVIAGHRSYAHGEHFNRLGEVAVGDEIRYLSIGGEEMTFVVDEVLEVSPGDPAAFTQPEDKAQITLYTCTPIRTATRRLLVRATRIMS